MNVDVILCIMIICLAGVVMVVSGFKVENTTAVNVSEKCSSNNMLLPFLYQKISSVSKETCFIVFNGDKNTKCPFDPSDRHCCFPPRNALNPCRSIL